MAKEKKEKKKKKGGPIRKLIKFILWLIVIIILIVAAYVAYVFISYHRVGNMELEVQHPISQKVETGQNYDIVSWNVGFGAYTDDFGFFMDGGDSARAASKTALDENLLKIGKVLSGLDADFYLIEEVDIDATRSYNVDERSYFSSALPKFTYTFAENWDCPYLFWPLIEPHGSAQCGIMTFSAFNIENARRTELPVEKGYMKIVDLDRCYSTQYLPMENGKQLVLYTFHLSAYTSDGLIANEQLRLLLADMQTEYEKGNYCIAGGDFNKDILGDSSKYFGVSTEGYTWATPIPEGTFDSFNVRLVAPEPNAPSCRNADGPVRDGQLVLTVDGFMVTDNVDVASCEVIDEKFAYSDHNPVTMSFTLQ